MIYSFCKSAYALKCKRIQKYTINKMKQRSSEKPSFKLCFCVEFLTLEIDRNTFVKWSTFESRSH